MRTRVFWAAVGILVLLPVAWHVTAQDTTADVLTGSDIELTPDMESWIEEARLEGGVHIGEFGDMRLVLVAAGQKPTAGYDLEVVDVVREELTWVVKVSLNSPEGMAAQVISYPYGLVAVAGEQDIPIRVKDADTGEGWTP